MKPTLFLLDALALIYRAYYAMIKSPRITSKGLNTSAILGFTNTLYEVLKNEKPTHIAVSFDTGAPTLRHADFADYKANRTETPEDIINAIPYIKTILEAFNIPSLQMDGYEADDIIGTLAKKAEIEGFRVFMMTSDKDYGQLVSENISIYRPGKFGQKADVLGVTEVCEKFAIQNPEQLIDILGLWGDASDNIPGVYGVGEVKAKKLVAQFGSIENMYKNINLVDNAKLKQTLIDNQEQALLSKMLATIILDVPIDYNFDEMKYTGPNVNKLKTIFNELEFKALGQRIFSDLSVSQTASSVMPDLFSSSDNIPPSSNDVLPSFEKYSPELVPTLQIYSEDELPELFGHDDQIVFEWILVNQKIAGFSFALLHRKQIYYHFLENQKQAYKPILRLLFEQDNLIVTYQSKATYKFFKSLKINHFFTFFDLQIAHYLIQPENSHLLNRLCETYLNYQLTEEHDRLELSACEKVMVYQKLYPILKKSLADNQMLTLFNTIEMPLVEVLADMEYAGVKVDTDVLQQNSVLLNQDILNLESQIYQLAGEHFNIASPKQLGDILFAKLKIIENAKLTKTKQYQTGEEILNKLVNKHPIVSLILEWRSLSKLKSTYIDALPLLINSKTGKIHTTFNQTVTSTGRLSSANPNLQNIPIRSIRGKDIRRAFVPSNERAVIVSADYSQVELRIVAAVCEDEKMIATFCRHEDIHSSMAAHIFHVDEADVTSEMRRKAKTVNFGILYGMSAFGLADRLHIPQKEARDLITDYFDSFPKISEWLANTIEFARVNGYVETLLGRRRYIGDIGSGNAILRKVAERNAINAPIQGTAADLIKIAMINIQNELKDRHLSATMILQVHDELVFEVPIAELDEVQEIVKSKMETAMNLAVPLEVEIKAGKSWFEAH